MNEQIEMILKLKEMNDADSKNKKEKEKIENLAYRLLKGNK